MKAKDKAKVVASLLIEKKGLDVRVLDLAELNTFTDFLVIATGTSQRHARALAEDIEIQYESPSGEFKGFRITW